MSLCYSAAGGHHRQQVQQAPPSMAHQHPPTLQSAMQDPHQAVQASSIKVNATVHDDGFTPLTEKQHNLYSMAVESNGNEDDEMVRHPINLEVLKRSDFRRLLPDTMLNDEVSVSSVLEYAHL